MMDIEQEIMKAEAGDAGAQNNLGVCYYKGEGVPQDYHKAVEWYTKAAEQALWSHGHKFTKKCKKVGKKG